MSQLDIKKVETVSKSRRKLHEELVQLRHELRQAKLALAKAYKESRQSADKYRRSVIELRKNREILYQQKEDSDTLRVALGPLLKQLTLPDRVVKGVTDVLKNEGKRIEEMLYDCSNKQSDRARKSATARKMQELVVSIKSQIGKIKKELW